MITRIAVLFLCAGAVALADPSVAAPPANNVHLVVHRGKSYFWRGAAPRDETLQTLSKEAQARGVQVTVFDLRHPATSDDLAGKEHKLTPDQEKALSTKLGIHYESVSALEKKLPDEINEALKQGDVYIHCQYGVNRTGFAVARFALVDKEKVDRKGLGERDWQQGVDFQNHQK